MKQVTLLFLLLYVLAMQLTAQSVSIQKSHEVVVIKGKEYYLHTVEKGQTLYSISKAYAVSLNEILKENNKSDNILALHDIIKIPYRKPKDVKPIIEPGVPNREREQMASSVRNETLANPEIPVERREREFYRHTVKPGETLYSIARMYDIKVKRILRFNKQLSDKITLNVGDVVLLPMKEITVPQEQTTVERVEVIVEKSTEIPETKVEEKEKSEPVVTISSVADSVITIAPIGQMKFQPIRIALLLPLFAKEQVALTDTLAHLKTYRVLKKSEQFVQFYEGALVAFDSLQRVGYQIELYLFDTEKESMKMAALLPELNALNLDLIIGPVYGSVFSVVANGLTNKQIPIVYPLSSRGEEFKNLPNFIQVNPATTLQDQALVNLITKKSRNANLINMEAYSADKSLLERVRHAVAVSKQESPDTLHFYTWNFRTMPFAEFHSRLSKSTENVIFFPSTNEAEVGQVMAQLGVLADHYPISVIGLSEWQDFSSIEGELFYKLNVAFVSPNYIDNNKLNTKNFAKAYRTYCHAHPSNLAYRAYDLMLYIVPLVASYRQQSLDALLSNPGYGTSSPFHFGRIVGGAGIENKGLYLITFTNEFELSIEPISIP